MARQLNILKNDPWLAPYAPAIEGRSGERGPRGSAPKPREGGFGVRVYRSACVVFGGMKRPAGQYSPPVIPGIRLDAIAVDGACAGVYIGVLVSFSLFRSAATCIIARYSAIPLFSMPALSPIPAGGLYISPSKLPCTRSAKPLFLPNTPAWLL